jgi:Tfp pilus assembly protein PilO
MRLKLIIVPALVILTLIISISFIKPDYDTLVQKKALLKQKQAEVAKIESTKANIASLVQNLDSKSDMEKFTLRYYPETMDQERVIDSFNFMALQSGLIIDSMEMKEIIVEKEESLGVGGPLTSVPGPGEMAPIEGGSPDLMMPMVPTYKTPTPGSYVAQVRAKGGYENIKNFLDRLSRMDRMNSLVQMSIKVDEKEVAEGTEEVAATSGQLIGTFEARFDYVKGKEKQNAIGIPIFEKGTLSLETIEQAQARATSAVPVLTVNESGRANPFQ